MEGNRLAEEEERRLWSSLEDGDSSAREDLILAYRPLVFWIAKKFNVGGDIYPDLIQEGMMALIKGIDSFDPSRGFRFTTYGYYRIRGQMLNYLQRKEAKAPLPMDSFDEELRDPMSSETIDAVLDLKDGLRHLPEREARILSDLIMEGRNAKDVAMEENIDVSHVYRLRRKALGWLKSWLTPKDATSRG